MMNEILAFQLAATAFMVGLIWFVQLVHYPLMAAVGDSHFQGYEIEHQRRTSWVVGPVMIAELGLSVASVLWPPVGDQWLMIVGLSLLALIWISTALLQVPAHRSLTTKFSEIVHRKLVLTNWIRTVAWTARALLLMIAAMNDAV